MFLDVPTQLRYVSCINTWDRLEKLELKEFGGDAIWHLAQCRLPSLRELTMDSWRFIDQKSRNVSNAFATAYFLLKLKKLTLRFIRDKSAIQEFLKECTALEILVLGATLEPDGNLLDAVCEVYLPASRREFEHDFYFHCPEKQQAEQLLANQSNWPCLEEMNLANSDCFKDTTLCYIAKSDWKLKHLELENSGMTAVGISAITKCSWAKALTYLSFGREPSLLNRVRMDDEVMSHIAAGKAFNISDFAQNRCHQKCSPSLAR